MEDEFLYLLMSNNNTTNNTYTTTPNQTNAIMSQEPQIQTPPIKTLIKKHNKTLIKYLKEYITKKTTKNNTIDELFYKLFVAIENK